ncbi:hypothetical protein GCM10010429_39140 [Micromonospora olivasterospora]
MYWRGRGWSRHTRRYPPPGSDRPGLTLPKPAAPAIPDRPGAVSTNARRVTVWWPAPLEGTSMPSKPKPETTDEAREQARRALQTSMDTRQ